VDDALVEEVADVVVELEDVSDVVVVS